MYKTQSDGYKILQRPEPLWLISISSLYSMALSKTILSISKIVIVQSIFIPVRVLVGIWYMLCSFH